MELQYLKSIWFDFKVYFCLAEVFLLIFNSVFKYSSVPNVMKIFTSQLFRGILRYLK